MSDLKEYQDADGHTFLLNAKDAEASGFKLAPERKNKQAKAPQNKQVVPQSVKDDDPDTE